MKERLEILKDLWDYASMSERAMGIAIGMIIVIFLVGKLV